MYFLIYTLISLITVSSIDIINLPLGYFPEGISSGDGSIIYVGSLNDGSIWKGDLTTGNGSVIISENNKTATGIAYDKRSGYLYVCGGALGTVSIYDTQSNYTMIKDFKLNDNNTFINDVIIGHDSVFITDSFQPQLYKLNIDTVSGNIDCKYASILTLGSNFTFIEGSFNTNGIEWSNNKDNLIIVNMASGELFTVDPNTGTVNLIDIGSDVVHGDGLIVRKDTMWVIENTASGGEYMQISEISLSRDLTHGIVVRRIQNNLFDYPTTGIRKGNSIYTVVSKLGLSFVKPELIPNTTYQIVRVDRDEP